MPVHQSCSKMTELIYSVPDSRFLGWRRRSRFRPGPQWRQTTSSNTGKVFHQVEDRARDYFKHAEQRSSPLTQEITYFVLRWNQNRIFNMRILMFALTYSVDSQGSCIFTGVTKKSPLVYEMVCCTKLLSLQVRCVIINDQSNAF